MLAFGAKVTVRAILRRESRSPVSGSGVFKFWGRKELKTPRTALYIGKRTLANGQVYYGGRDEGTEFNHTEKVPALLVVFSEREKPVYALADDVTEPGETKEK